MVMDQRQEQEARASEEWYHPLFFITYPYIAHCMGACSAKGDWSLFSLSLSLARSLRAHCAQPPSVRPARESSSLKTYWSESTLSS